MTLIESLYNLKSQNLNYMNFPIILEKDYNFIDCSVADIDDYTSCFCNKENNQLAIRYDIIDIN